MEQAPADLVVVGRVAEAWGVQGGIKVMPFSSDADAVLAAREWWLSGPGSAPLRSVEVFSAKPHAEFVRALLVGFPDRSAAEKLKGAQVLVPRSRFPVLPDGEYYWVDLVGLEVVNEGGDCIGTVTGLTESGAHALLEVERVVDDKPVQQLIPFVDAHIRSVDRVARRIVVDWGLDY